MIKKFKTWAKFKIGRQIAIGAFFSIITISLLFLALSFSVELYLIKENKKKENQQRLERISASIDTKIDLFVNQTINLSKNPLISTAIQDSKGNDKYLINFIFSYQTPLNKYHGLALCNVDGRMLASTQDHQLACMKNRPESHAVLETLQPQTLVHLVDKRTYLILLQPVFSSEKETVKGYITSALDLQSFISNPAQIPSAAVLEIHSQDNTFFVSSQDQLSAIYQGRAVDSFSQDFAASGPFADAGLHLTLRQPHLPLSGTPQLLLSYAAATVFLLILAFFMARKIATNLSAPLIALNEAARRTGQQGSAADAIKLDRQDEIGELASSFNHMVAKLQEAQETMESAVQARTAELRKALGKIGRSEMLLHRLFTYAPLGFGILGPSTTFIRCNGALLRMLGYSENELREKLFTEIIHQADREREAGLLQDLFAGNISEFFREDQLIRKNGSVIWAKISASLILDYASGQVNALAIIEDITEQKEAEQYRIQSMLEQRNALVREVNHRIKNNIQASVSLLLRRLGNHAEVQGELKEVLDNAVTQLESIATVHGLQASNFSNQCGIRDLLENICALARHQLKSNVPGIALHSRIDCNENIVLSEEESTPIALIINELLTNAIKHCRREYGEIALYTTEEKTALCIWIENDCKHDTRFEPNVGLDLVNALLPKEGAKLAFNTNNHKVIVQLILTPPVIK